jgi:hypothetical protein
MGAAVLGPLAAEFTVVKAGAAVLGVTGGVTEVREGAKQGGQLGRARVVGGVATVLSSVAAVVPEGIKAVKWVKARLSGTKTVRESKAAPGTEVVKQPVDGASEGSPAAAATTSGGAQAPDGTNTKSGQTTAIVKYDPKFASEQLLGESWETAGGRTIGPHAAERMKNPPRGRAPMSKTEVDEVLDTANKVRKVTQHPEGDTITVQRTDLPGKPQVVVDAATGKRVITVVKNSK